MSTIQLPAKNLIFIFSSNFHKKPLSEEIQKDDDAKKSLDLDL